MIETEVTINEIVIDIVIRIRFFSICLAVAVLIGVAQQYVGNCRPLIERQVYEALDPAGYQRALLAAAAEPSDEAAIVQAN